MKSQNFSRLKKVYSYPEIRYFFLMMRVTVVPISVRSESASVFRITVANPAHGTCVRLHRKGIKNDSFRNHEGRIKTEANFPIMSLSPLPPLLSFSDKFFGLKKPAEQYIFYLGFIHPDAVVRESESFCSYSL